MYDSHIWTHKYRDLKDYIIDCLNGDIPGYDADKVADRIQEAYEEGNLSSSQYDDLMGYVIDL